MSRLSSLFLGKKEEEKEEQHLPRVKFRREGRYQILFVDDEAGVLNTMRRIFRHENYTLHTAHRAEEALEIMARHPIHVVVSDYRMPGMNGADLLRKVKAQYPATIRIMLTGYADVNAIMGAVNDGAVYKFITKPWNDEDFRLTISLALEQYDLVQENKALKKKQEVQKKEIKKLARFFRVNRSQLGRMLVKNEQITQQDLDNAVEIQGRTNKIMPAVLMEMQVVDEATILKTIEQEQRIQRVFPNEFPVHKALATLIPREICEQNLLVPLKSSQGSLIVAMADPTDYMKVDDLKFLIGMSIKPALSTRQEILDRIEELYGEKNAEDDGPLDFEFLDPAENIEIILEEEDEDLELDELFSSKEHPPAVRIVNAILSDALRHKASDIHIEPKTKHVMVRYRMDGLLHDKIHIPLSMHPAVVSRIKVMSDLDIAERRKPQDGRITVKTSSKMVDMRISTLPTILGEKVVLRILDKNGAIMSIEDLGFSEPDLHRVSRFVEQPQGIVLTTGPTGSGKTSLLYSLLQKGATITKNYATIEDPVEFNMPMAGQVAVRSKIGLDFPMVLRALLRQDPNVIMLGEIRDFETAEVAFHAALTGHLVLSTLHTNGSVASITRLRDLGIKPYVISEALVGIVSQRLVRKICPECARDDTPDEKILKGLRIDPEDVGFNPKRGSGCLECNRIGYKGRTGIFEVLCVDRDIKQLIHGDASEVELVRAAKRGGMHTLFEHAMQKVKDGVTTCEEVLRVLGNQMSVEIQCPHCDRELSERFRFCPHCGGTLIPLCAKCGQMLDPQWRACPDCGTFKEPEPVQSRVRSIPL